MSEPKPFASLSSGLLARKGAARPAMRPQGFGQWAAASRGSRLERHGLRTAQAGRRAVATTTMTRSARRSTTSRGPSDGPDAGPFAGPYQQAEIADRLARRGRPDEDFDETAELFETSPSRSRSGQLPASGRRSRLAARGSQRSAPAPRRAPRPRAAPGSKAKAAFTLRLDPARHLKLRLACAVGGRSAQLIVTDALDHARAHAGARRHGREGQTQGIIQCPSLSASLRPLRWSRLHR